MNKYPKVYKEETKYGDNYYQVNSKELEQKFFLDTFLKRWEEKEYAWMEKELKDTFEEAKRIKEYLNSKAAKSFIQDVDNENEYGSIYEINVEIIE